MLQYVLSAKGVCCPNTGRGEGVGGGGGQSGVLESSPGCGCLTWIPASEENKRLPWFYFLKQAQEDIRIHYIETNKQTTRGLWSQRNLVWGPNSTI